MITINKIKYSSSGKVQIQYQRPVEKGEPDEYSLSCSEAPRPAFIAALCALVPFAQDICEMPNDDQTRWMVKGVSLSRAGEEDTLGVVLICTRRLDNSNIGLNLCTPIKIEEFYTGGREKGDVKQLMSEFMVEAIYNLIYEAEAYINGQRAQTELEVVK